MADKLPNNRLVVTYEFDSQKERDDAENYAVEMKKGFFGEPSDSFTGHIISTEVSSRKIYLEPQEPQEPQQETRQTWDRQTVLEEKWLPHEGQPEMLFYPVQTGNSIGQFNTLIHTIKGLKKYQNHHGYSFAPTRELAEEIAQIREGKWLPKKGDYYYAFERANGHTFDYLLTDRSTIDKNGQGWLKIYAYYPSAEQRDKHIPKQHTFVQEPRLEPEQGTRIAIVKRSLGLNTLAGFQQENEHDSITIEELARLLRNVDYSRAEAIPGVYSDNSRKEGRG